MEKKYDTMHTPSLQRHTQKRNETKKKNRCEAKNQKHFLFWVNDDDDKQATIQMTGCIMFETLPYGRLPFVFQRPRACLSLCVLNAPPFCRLSLFQTKAHLIELNARCETVLMTANQAFCNPFVWKCSVWTLKNRPRMDKNHVAIYWFQAFRIHLFIYLTVTMATHRERIENQKRGRLKMVYTKATAQWNILQKKKCKRWSLQ